LSSLYSTPARRITLLLTVTRIGEKHLEWSDPREPIALDTILGMVTLYWFTSTFPRALYHAQLVKNLMAGRPHPFSKEKPFGYSLFPYDLVLVPSSWAKKLYPNLALFKTHTAVSIFSLSGMVNVC
jgi:hypothetical protein